MISETLQMAGIAGSLLAAIAALLTAREMHKQSNNSIRPYLVVFGVLFKRSSTENTSTRNSNFSVENVGQGPAISATISWDLSNVYKLISLDTRKSFVEIESSGAKSYYRIGDILNIKENFIRHGAKIDTRIPEIAVAIISIFLRNNFSQEKFNNIPDIFFFAKLEYFDVFGNGFIEYFRVDFKLIVYEVGKDFLTPSYRAIFEFTRSHRLEL